jgi:hypothetical protein
VNVERKARNTVLSINSRDVSTAYNAFGDDSSGYQELSEGEYVLSILLKWPALAQMNGLAANGGVSGVKGNSEISKEES